MLNEIKGNLLNANVDIICHQTNCVTKHGAGLARQIFDKFPIANTYKNRTKSEPELFGTVSFHKAEPFWIANMYAQVYPSSPKMGKFYSKGQEDSAEERILAFIDCINEVGLFCLKNSLTNVGFPTRIGCGLGGGSWKTYKSCLQYFAKTNPHLEIYIIDFIK